MPAQLIASKGSNQCLWLKGSGYIHVDATHLLGSTPTSNIVPMPCSLGEHLAWQSSQQHPRLRLWHQSLSSWASTVFMHAWHDSTCKIDLGGGGKLRISYTSPIVLLSRMTTREKLPHPTKQNPAGTQI